MYKGALPYEGRLPSTSHNSGYMVPLRFTQIFAPLRSAKTSYSRETIAAFKLHRSLYYCLCIFFISYFPIFNIY